MALFFGLGLSLSNPSHDCFRNPALSQPRLQYRVPPDYVAFCRLSDDKTLRRKSFWYQIFLLPSVAPLKVLYFSFLKKILQFLITGRNLFETNSVSGIILFSSLVPSILFHLSR